MKAKRKVFKTLIIDDEEPARNVIRRFLEPHPEFRVIAECEDGYEGAKCILSEKPDLVFLDVQMPRVNGFEMLELLDEKPIIIFSTAYHEYALRAFEVSAADFLLKPYSRERFNQALDKAIRLLSSNAPQTSLAKLEKVLGKNPEPLHRIVVRKRSGIFVIPVNEIHYLSAQDDYVEIITPKGKFLKKQTLSYFETHLPSDGFIRIHRSFIVNITQIHRIEPYAKNSYRLFLHDGTTLAVSRSGMQDLKTKLNL